MPRGWRSLVGSPFAAGALNFFRVPWEMSTPSFRDLLFSKPTFFPHNHEVLSADIVFVEYSLNFITHVVTNFKCFIIIVIIKFWDEGVDRK